MVTASLYPDSRSICLVTDTHIVTVQRGREEGQGRGRRERVGGGRRGGRQTGSERKRDRKRRMRGRYGQKE